VTKFVQSSCVPQPHYVYSHRCVDPGAEGGEHYASAARFNHSCAPNAHQSFDAHGCVTVDTVRRVKKGEELTIPYVDTRLSGQERRAKLRKNFAFECACVRCLAEQ